MPPWAVGIVAGSFVLALFVALGFTLRLVKKMALRTRAEVRERVGVGNILAEEPSANCFGVQSRGMGQGRGNGCWVVTAERIHFQFWAGGRIVEIPLAQVTGTRIERSFLGKTKGRELLVVEWEREDGTADACAWQFGRSRDVQRTVDDLISRARGGSVEGRSVP